MSQAQKWNGEWVKLEARTDGYYDGEIKVCDILGGNKHFDYIKLILKQL